MFFFAWKPSYNGSLIVKDAYNSITKPCTSTAWKFFPWDINSPPSHSMLVWRYIHNKLPNNDKMLIMGFSFPSICSLRNSCCESSRHLLFECPFAINIWNWLVNLLETSLAIASNEDCKQLLCLS